MTTDERQSGEGAGSSDPAETRPAADTADTAGEAHSASSDVEGNPEGAPGEAPADAPGATPGAAERQDAGEAGIPDDGSSKAHEGEVRRTAPTYTDDWSRYGLGQDTGRVSKPAGRPSTRRENRDDLFLEYRRENRATRAARAADPRRSARRTGNLIGLAGVALLLVSVVVLGIVTIPGPKPTPTPVPRPSHSTRVTAPPDASASPSEAALATPEPVAVLPNVLDLQLPFAVDIPDRAYDPSEGGVMYLVGSSANAGAVAIDPTMGKVVRQFGGEAFGKGVRRSIVAVGSLWVSSWPAQFTTCGGPCWSQAVTYRIDLQTGKVSQVLPKTYLVGLSADALWVASAGKIDQLDLTTANTIASTPWSGTEEPRVGCGGLWAVNADDPGAPILTLVDARSGKLGSPLPLPAGDAYGPISVSSRCWMVGPSAGAAGNVSTNAAAQIDGDGSLIDIKSFDAGFVVLDHQFWTIDGDILRQIDPGTTERFGPPYRLQGGSARAELGTVFYAAGRLWAADGVHLTGFDMPSSPSSRSRGSSG